MNLGAKLLQARQEAGLSQRQVCGDVITRNMLSQLEHGTARPSMQTLQYLAEKLGKPMSFFLEEESAVSPNQKVMLQAKKQFDAGAYGEVLKVLSEYKAPDPVSDTERAFLSFLSMIGLAEVAIGQDKTYLARNLLEEASYWEGELWMLPELRYRRVRLLGRLRGQNLTAVCESLPSLDEDLMLRARAELDAGNPLRAGQLLDAAQSRGSQWQLLRGRAHFGQRQYNQAAACLKLAEAEDPKTVYPLLEKCYRELQDYKNAYLYACKQREE